MSDQVLLLRIGHEDTHATHDAHTESEPEGEQVNIERTEKFVEHTPRLKLRGQKVRKADRRPGQTKKTADRSPQHRA